MNIDGCKIRQNQNPNFSDINESQHENIQTILQNPTTTNFSLFIIIIIINYY